MKWTNYEEIEIEKAVKDIETGRYTINAQVCNLQCYPLHYRSFESIRKKLSRELQNYRNKQYDRRMKLPVQRASY